MVIRINISTTIGVNISNCRTPSSTDADVIVRSYSIRRDPCHLMYLFMVKKGVSNAQIIEFTELKKPLAIVCSGCRPKWTHNVFISFAIVTEHSVKIIQHQLHIMSWNFSNFVL